MLAAGSRSALVNKVAPATKLRDALHAPHPPGPRTSPQRARLRTHPHVGHVALAYIFVAVATLLILLPLWTMLVASVSPLSQLYGSGIPLWPSSFHFDSFVKAWNAAPFGRYYVNSVLVTMVILAFQLTTCSMAAYALAFFRSRAGKVIYGVVLLALFVPTQVIFVAAYILMKDFGWINSYQALIVPFATSAFGIFFLTQSFKSFPFELIESARVDGSGHVRALWSMVLPNMKPALAALAVINGVFHYNYFFWPLVITNTYQYRVLPVGLAMMAAQSGGDQLVPWNQVMAADAFTMIPLMVLFVLTQKWMVRGVARTGLR